MQKKIIVLAIAAALTAPAMALAEANVYGLVDLSIDMYKSGATGSGAGVDNSSVNQLNSNNSRVGFKGSEDLGGGMSAVWQMEGTVSMDAGAGGGTTNSATALFDRNTFIGLSSKDMGTLALGQHDTPYKISTRKLDVFADSLAADNRNPMGVGMMGSLGGFGALDARLSNVIAYISPDMSGFTVAAAKVFGAENTGTGTVAVPTPKKGDALSLAGMYEQGPIYATLAYQTLKYGDAGTGDLAAGAPLLAEDEIKSFKLGGSYTMDQIAVNLVFEKPKYSPGAASTAAGSTSTDSTNIYLSGKFNVSSTDAVKLAYTKRGESKSAGTSNKDGATQIALGYDHGMSKTTTVYALYTKVSQDDPAAPAAPNPDPSTIAFGIKHSF